MPSAVSPVPWEGWGPAALTRASREDRPIFLYLCASWAPACADVERQVLGAAPVVHLLSSAFVPIRADVERCPELVGRYGLGSWPSLLVLTPSGDVLTGGTRPVAAHLAAQLVRVRDAYRGHRHELVPPPARATSHPAGPPGAASDLTDAFIARWRAEMQGAWLESPWGTHLGVLRGVAACWTTLGADDQALATRWLEALAALLVDPVSGAVRHPEPGEADGRLVHLRWQVAMLHALADMAAVLPDAGVHALLGGVGTCLRRDLRHPSGGFLLAARRPGDGGTSSVAVDLRRAVDANAAAALALLRVAAVTGDAASTELAMVVLERVVGVAYERGAGVAHLLEPSPNGRGWIGDQVWSAAALLEAFRVTGLRVYLDLAEELARSLLRGHWDDATGALCDTPVLSGEPAGPRWHPLAANALAARVLLALSRQTGAPDLVAAASRIVAWGAPALLAGDPDGVDLLLPGQAPAPS